MKRIIVTLCTLALSAAGTFGANKLSLQNDNTINNNSNYNTVVQNAEDTKEQTNLPSVNNTTVVSGNEDALTAVAKEVAPAEKKAVKETTNVTMDNNGDNQSTNTTAQIQNTVNIAAQNNNTGVINTKVENSPATTTTTQVQNNGTANAVANNTAKAIPVSCTTGNNTLNTNNGQVYVFKNVDLSNCNNTQDVVNKLQKYGFKNITTSNINQISSLKDILSTINGAKNSNTGKTTPAPTSKPTPTTVPAPTTKPTPTTVPAPTTKPAPTTAPAPTAKPTPTKAPSNNSGISSYANQVLQLVNQERAKAGLSALTTNSTLAAAANKRAQETVQSFSHTRPNGTSFSTVLKEYGISYRTAGENIAYGQKSPQEVVNGWMNSPGHRANILNANYNKIGIGVYQQNGVIYWSQLFTN